LGSGKSINISLPLGGFGISSLSWISIYIMKKKKWLYYCKEMVSDVNFKADIFTITTNLNTYTAIVIGAFGKDQILM
jgi:hypothetical protein